MALFNKKNLGNCNQYGISKKDMKGDLKDFPVGVVVRMMEEQKRQGNYPDVEVFQNDISSNYDEGGFSWDKTEDGHTFWLHVIAGRNFKVLFKEYPEYEKYN